MVRTADTGDGRGGCASVLKLVSTYLPNGQVSWHLLVVLAQQIEKTRLTKRVLVWTGPDPYDPKYYE